MNTQASSRSRANGPRAPRVEHGLGPPRFPWPPALERVFVDLCVYSAFVVGSSALLTTCHPNNRRDGWELFARIVTGPFSTWWEFWNASLEVFSLVVGGTSFLLLPLLVYAHTRRRACLAWAALFWLASGMACSGGCDV